MNIRNFEKFQMSITGYIYVSKKTRKIHAIELKGSGIRLVQTEDKEAHLLIKGLLLNGQSDYSSEFSRLMDFVDKDTDPFLWDALRTFRECCHSRNFDAAIGFYTD